MHGMTFSFFKTWFPAGVGCGFAVTTVCDLTCRYTPSLALQVHPNYAMVTSQLGSPHTGRHLYQERRRKRWGDLVGQRRHPEGVRQQGLLPRLVISDWCREYRLRLPCCRRRGFAPCALQLTLSTRHRKRKFRNI